MAAAQPDTNPPTSTAIQRRREKFCLFMQ
jgi:hypothetical protein